jgi:hypothetical protein
MGNSYDIDMSEYVPFERVSDEDLLKARIFNRCRMSDKGCWLWSGPFGSGGYGSFSVRDVDQRAHRASYTIFKGPIPKGLHVLHRCDTPACVNPAHLRVGTHRENMTERDTRGRRDVRGEKIGTAKLTIDQVIEIKKSSLGLKALAEMYDVKYQTIWRIRAGQAWAHVTVSENVDAR